MANQLCNSRIIDAENLFLKVDNQPDFIYIAALRVDKMTVTYK